MKALRLSLLAILIGVLLCGCTRTIRDPADELTMFSWEAESENGSCVQLSFDDNTARFTAQNDTFVLSIDGVYLIDDTTIVISDAQTLMNYSFTYLVHGDSVDLTYGGGTITLDKKSDL